MARDQTEGMRVRPELYGDGNSIRAVHRDAFRHPETPETEPPEVGLVDRLRATDAWIPGLSLVAVVEDEVVGHVCTTRGHVGGEPVLALGPIGVITAHQGRGIGSALVTETVRISRNLGEHLIALLGSPTYYGRFGFKPSVVYGIEPPDPSWDNHFQIKLLSEPRSSIKGTFQYAPPFDSVSS